MHVRVLRLLRDNENENWAIAYQASTLLIIDFAIREAGELSERDSVGSFALPETISGDRERADKAGREIASQINIRLRQVPISASKKNVSSVITG